MKDNPVLQSIDVLSVEPEQVKADSPLLFDRLAQVVTMNGYGEFTTGTAHFGYPFGSLAPMREC
jgi:hypothetical protein